LLFNLAWPPADLLQIQVAASRSETVWRICFRIQPAATGFRHIGQQVDILRTGDVFAIASPNSVFSEVSDAEFINQFNRGLPAIIA
jgi:hypothetical protein